MYIADPNDETDVKYHSSINQHRGGLTVYAKGSWKLISYDVLDYIDCDEIKSHKAVAVSGDDIGFSFPTGKAVLYTDEYVYHDHHSAELRVLPHWFGEGTFLEYIKKSAFINADNGSLGARNKYNLTIGLDYALAEHTLESADEE